MATYLEVFPKLRKFTPVVVSWHDACDDNTHDQKSTDALANDKPVIRQTIGWYIGLGEFNVIIAMESDKKRSEDDTDCGGIGRIPKRMVTQIRKLTFA